MKKIISILLCLMMIPLFSCGLNEDKDPPSQSETTSTQISDAEKAMEMYEAAINDEICVFDERLGEIKLKSLRFTSNDTSLNACKLLKEATLDIDQDGINEYVIQSPNNEYIILRYYNGKVYSYWLDTDDFYNFNTDGSFYWYESSEAEGWECGLNKIIFDGSTLNVKSIYCLEYSENPTKYEYFVEGEAVTEDEYYDYRSQHWPKEIMTFSQFEMNSPYPITAEKAWNLANAYWDNQDGRKDYGAGSVFTVRIVLIDTPNSYNNYYRVAFQAERNSNGGMEGHECMPPCEITLKDQILVNAFTGEIAASTYDPNNKGVSVEEAIEIAKKYSMESDACNEENAYRVEYAPDGWAPDHVYVIAIQKHDIYRNRIWVDKNTGEIIYPYYLNGK